MRAFLVTVVPCLLSLGCAHPSDQACTPLSSGYVETASHREDVIAAITKANSILGVDGYFQFDLRTSDRADGTTAKPAKPERIPVWVVAERGLGPTSIAFAQSECRVVVVQAPAMASRIQAWNGDPNTGMEIDQSSVIAWLLLHEVGHLSVSESGLFEAAPMVRGVNFDETPEKKKEAAADFYAAKLVLQGKQQTALAPMLAAERVSLALTAVSWNLFRDRMLDDFGATALGLPHAFGDPGYTHPNLELRIMVANAWISGTPDSEKQVRDFLQGRSQALRR